MVLLVVLLGKKSWSRVQVCPEVFDVLVHIVESSLTMAAAGSTGSPNFVKICHTALRLITENLRRLERAQVKADDVALGCETVATSGLHKLLMGLVDGDYSTETQLAAVVALDTGFEVGPCDRPVVSRHVFDHAVVQMFFPTPQQRCAFLAEEVRAFKSTGVPRRHALFVRVLSRFGTLQLAFWLLPNTGLDGSAIDEPVRAAGDAFCCSA